MVAGMMGGMSRVRGVKVVCTIFWALGGASSNMVMMAHPTS